MYSATPPRSYRVEGYPEIRLLDLGTTDRLVALTPAAAAFVASPSTHRNP
ncbi:hypothetical protein [Streptomyces sp. NPDC051665]